VAKGTALVSARRKDIIKTNTGRKLQMKLRRI
jgi:hypothetical protein